jgi:hypothetical protein
MAGSFVIPLPFGVKRIKLNPSPCVCHFCCCLIFFQFFDLKVCLYHWIFFSNFCLKPLIGFSPNVLVKKFEFPVSQMSPGSWMRLGEVEYLGKNGLETLVFSQKLVFLGGLAKFATATLRLQRF